MCFICKMIRKRTRYGHIGSDLLDGNVYSEFYKLAYALIRRDFDLGPGYRVGVIDPSAVIVG